MSIKKYISVLKVAILNIFFAIFCTFYSFSFDFYFYFPVALYSICIFFVIFSTNKKGEEIGILQYRVFFIIFLLFSSLIKSNLLNLFILDKINEKLNYYYIIFPLLLSLGILYFFLKDIYFRLKKKDFLDKNGNNGYGTPLYRKFLISFLYSIYPIFSTYIGLGIVSRFNIY